MERWWNKTYERGALEKLYGAFDANVLLATAERGKPHEQAVAFPWERGDILMLDNMLVAHGRKPFTGPRKILVGMAEMTNAPGAPVTPQDQGEA